MSRPFPYTYISCPCADTPAPDPSRKKRSRESPHKAKADQVNPPTAGESDDEEQTFDPRSPRSNFSLYPPEQLLYCEDCHQIKCPRCITEEIVCWYCPNCLFETPSSMVRSEGNRCARNCFNCPICTAPLAVTTLENVTGGESHQGPWVLSCAYCMWTTLDIGIKFDKPTNIRIQLSKMADTSSRGRQMSKTVGELKSPLSSYSSIDDQFPAHGESRDGQSTPSGEQPGDSLSPDARFSALEAFYKDQIAATSPLPADPLGIDFASGFASPGALNRIMALYAASARLNNLWGTSKKPKSKLPVMREALTQREGLKIPDPDAEESIIRRIVSEDCGWDGLASMEQRMLHSPDARFVEDLLPLPVLLRTKRSKRCKSCKHILVKPEFKPQSTRFRIRLIALSYIPLPTLRPLVLPPTGLPSATSLSIPNLDALPPLKPIQVLLTLKNHMFDPVRVTLATPSVTPGRVATKVTILCPQFDIGANSDVWDEALQGTTAGDQRNSRSSGLNIGQEKVAEAGKVWDKGRNWTTVVLEVVPGTLPGGTAGFRKRRARDDDNTNGNQSSDDDDGDDNDDDDDGEGNLKTSLDWSGQAKDRKAQLQPDEDVLEIPVFVRLEWDSENQMEQSVGKAQGGSDTVKRELAYWMVLGVGRITDDLAL